MAEQLEHLVRMANQIALNMGAWGGPDVVAARVGEHLTKFWTPVMREQLLHYHRDGGGKLAPAVVAALQRTTPGKTRPGKSRRRAAPD